MESLAVAPAVTYDFGKESPASARSTPGSTGKTVPLPHTRAPQRATFVDVDFSNKDQGAVSS
jgi:hypothetical protein